MANSGESIMELCAFSVNKPREWLNTVPSDEGVLLLRSIFEVNADFFSKRIAPAMGLSVIVTSDGSTASTSLSEQVTDAGS